MQTDEHRDRLRLYPWVGVLAGVVLLVAAAWAAEFIPGDVNDDGVFDIADPTVLRRELAGLGPGISQLCGNGLLDPNEDCDFGVICPDFGFAFGELVCGEGCVAEVNTCTNDRFEDLGLTVFDHQTGLEWEKKTNDGSIHDKDDRYKWTATSLGTVPDGTAFTIFLGTLNNGTTSSGGGPITGCFAGYCDWRLPSVTELQTILLQPHPCGTSPCIDQTIFGPTISGFYWSSSSFANNAGFVFTVNFSDGFPGTVFKDNRLFVRAVRSGPPTCGDGLLNQASEECDSPNDSACPGTCMSDCTCPAPPACGDGVSDTGEECDDGNTQSGDCCSSTCLFEASSVVCRSAAGACDVPEFCTGGNASCPSDRVADQGTPCDDGLGCTAGDGCDGGGVCVGGLIDCSTLDGPCTVGICNEASATCVADPTPLEGAPCDDGVLCTTASTCNAGFCSGGIPASCDDRNVCTDDFCDPVRGCQNAPIIDGTPCDDGLFCTTGDICTAGACGGRARDCSGADSLCAEGVCDEVGDACMAHPTLPQGTICGPNGVICIGGSCVCPGGPVETTCSDAVDNDCDGLVDCADSDCQGNSCGFGRVCSLGSCVCPGGPFETTCSDAIDNDCDGLADCSDADCDGNSCGPGFVCVGGSCVSPF